MTIEALLRVLYACQEVRDWATGKTLQEAWTTCDRGDWMLWLCARMIGQPGWPTHQEVVLAACACAAEALRYVDEGETRPREAIRITRLWCRGRATIGQVRTAAHAASAAASAAADGAAAQTRSRLVSARIVRKMLTIPT